jgi:hypothetical protein
VQSILSEKLRRPIFSANVPKIMACTEALQKGVSKEGMMWPISVEGGNVIAKISFYGFDKDGNGRLDKEEFLDCMKYGGEQQGKPYTPEILEKMRKEADTNADNWITLEEYTAVIQKGLQALRDVSGLGI